MNRPRSGPQTVREIIVLVILLVVAGVFGVGVGGAILAGLGVTLTVIAGVVGLVLWRRDRRVPAVVAFIVAALALVGAVAGFVDAVA